MRYGVAFDALASVLLCKSSMSAHSYNLVSRRVLFDDFALVLSAIAGLDKSKIKGLRFLCVLASVDKQSGGSFLDGLDEAKTMTVKELIDGCFRKYAEQGEDKDVKNTIACVEAESAFTNLGTESAGAAERLRLISSDKAREPLAALELATCLISLGHTEHKSLSEAIFAPLLSNLDKSVAAPSHLLRTSVRSFIRVLGEQYVTRNGDQCHFMSIKLIKCMIKALPVSRATVKENNSTVASAQAHEEL